jgi:ribosomal protein S6
VRDYELTYIVRPDLDDKGTKAAAERVQGWITQGGGSLTNVQEWGKRRLAYPISHHAEGTYYVYRVQMDPDAAAGIEHELNLDEQVLRFLMLQLDPAELEALKNPPPPPMARPVREDRGEASRTPARTEAPAAAVAAPAAETQAAEAPAAEAPAAETPAAEASATEAPATEAPAAEAPAAEAPAAEALAEMEPAAQSGPTTEAVEAEAEAPVEADVATAAAAAAEPEPAAEAPSAEPEAEAAEEESAEEKPAPRKRATRAKAAAAEPKEEAAGEGE